MPKPDQNVSSSAALQRPQRQKALPKPLPKNIETDPEILTKKVAEPVEISAEISFDLGSELSQSELGSPELNPELSLESSQEAIADKSKPKLKPQLKPRLKPQAVTESVVLQENSPEQDEILVESVESVAPVLEIIEVETLENDPEENIEVFDLDLEITETGSEKANQDPAIAPSEPIFWCQAVGLVAGKYIPGSEAFQKGELLTNNGFTYKGYVLSKAIKSLEKKTDLSLVHQFVVYPKTSKQHGVRFEILATDVASKIDEFEDGQFNIRGLVTKQLENSFLVEIQRRPEYLHPSQYDRFTLEVKGILPAELVQQLIYLKCQLTENYLSLINYEHLACPIITKVTKSETKTEKPILKPKAPNLESIESEPSSPDQDP
jgi:hypothetical protein